MAKTRKKTGKKQFFCIETDVSATPIEVYSYSIEDIEGKSILLDLTRNLKGKGVELMLRIVKEGEKLVGRIEKFKLVSSYVKKLTRKGSDYCEDSFVVNCKDAKITVKPFLVTKKSVSRNILKVLRENMRKYLENYFKIRDVKELFNEIITMKLQKALSQNLKKIYPLAVCEIRVFEVVGRKNDKEGEKEAKKEEDKESSIENNSESK